MSQQNTGFSPAFEVNQQVVYPLQGVGKILRIEDRNFKDQVLQYYIIYLEVTDMTVMVPVDKAAQLGIRAIVPAEEAERAIMFNSDAYDPAPADWKARYQMNLDLLKQGSVIDIAQVVRMLYHRSKVKELPILERKLFDGALKILLDEVTFSLGKKKEEVEQLIFARLEAELPEKLKTAIRETDLDDDFDDNVDLESDDIEDSTL